MPIDIVKKNDKDSTVNLKKRQFLYKKDEKTKKQKNKKSLEERLEKRFSHLPDMAYKQKRKIIWSTVIFFSAIIVFFWFYLASQGVLFYKSKDKEEQGGFLKLSELTYGFNKIKNISISSLPEKKDFILNLKKQIELAAEKNEIINSLKDNLQKKSEGEYNSESNKVVCDSGNLAATYPLPDYYIDNPVKILGRGKLLSGEFKISLKDSNGKILGESTGITEKGETMSAFAVELNYSAPETKTGVLQLYALRQKDENKDDLISIPVNFIVDLPEWNIYSNEEFGLKLKYPKNSKIVVAQNGFLLNSSEETSEDKEKTAESRFYVDYFYDIKKLQENYAPNLLRAYENLDLFLESEILGENEKSFYIGGLNFNSIIGNDVFYRISEKETGEIAVIKSRGKESGSSEILDQILATFKFSESNFENWKEYNDTTGDVSFKYPAALNESEDLGQFVFRDKYPGGFSFYFFSIEPQIDNLEKWIQESPVNLEEEMEKYEYKSFGDAILGVYYEAKAKQADSAEDAPDTQDTRSFGYIFNHYGATYFLRTNKDNFQKTFKNVLDSIKFNFLDEEQDLNFESN